MNNNTWSFFDKNFHREAKNIVNLGDLTEVARPRFADFANDPKVQSALQDLNRPGVRQRRALDFLGLDSVPAMQVASTTTNLYQEFGKTKMG